MTDIPPALSDEVAHMRFLLDQDYRNPKPISGKRCACLVKFLFTWAILVTRIGDQAGYEDRWCYSSYGKAKMALELWDGTGEPVGWHRHPPSGRRRQFVDGQIVETISH
jgi:hypothetical protein